MHDMHHPSVIKKTRILELQDGRPVKEDCVSLEIRHLLQIVC